MIRGIIIRVLNGAVRLFDADGRDAGEFKAREFMQHYGYSSRPKAGAETVIVREGNHFVSIADGDRRYQIELMEGEVAIHDDRGQKAHLTRTGIVVTAIGTLEASATESAAITAPTITCNAETKVTLNTPLTECTGNLVVAGGISSSGTYGASGGKIQTPGDICSTGGQISDQVRSMADDRAIYNGHTHPENGDGGGTTGGPNEVM